jgi:hypothetical protein
MLSKPETQAILKPLRKQAGLTIVKANGGYTVTNDATEELVMQAMIGTRGYLVRFHKEYFNQ